MSHQVTFYVKSKKTAVKNVQEGYENIISIYNVGMLKSIVVIPSLFPPTMSVATRSPTITASLALIPRALGAREKILPSGFSQPTSTDVTMKSK